MIPAISTAFQEAKAKHGRVIGVDGEGLRRSIDIDEERNHTLYAEAEMDDVLAKVGSVSVEEFHSAAVFTWLATIAQQAGL